MSKIIESLRSATVAMILNTYKLKKIDTQHIINQKTGNNPIDSSVDNNIYTECKIKNVDSLIICGYGEQNDRGLGATRDIDYASYIVKIGAAITDVPLIRTNGPFSNSTTELEKFFGIWNKYYKTRTHSFGISIKDKPVNPFTVMSAGIATNNKNIHIEMLIANTKLVESNPNEFKYYGDVIIYATENLGFGTKYTQINKYSENPEERTTISALLGHSQYGQRLLETVEQSFEHIYFVLSELESIRPNLSITKKMLWVSNSFKQKT
jgi:hypothetical protein